MHSSLIIARLVGPLLATIGIGVMVNGTTYQQIGLGFVASPAIIYISGILLLTAGLAILNFHGRWTRDWRSVVTAIGFIFTIGGVWRLIAPQFVPFVGGPLLTSSGFLTGASIVLIALGGFLTFKGYVADGPVETQTTRTRVQGDFK